MHSMHAIPYETVAFQFTEKPKIKEVPLAEITVDRDPQVAGDYKQPENGAQSLTMNQNYQQGRMPAGNMRGIGSQQAGHQGTQLPHGMHPGTGFSPGKTIQANPNTQMPYNFEQSGIDAMNPVNFADSRKGKGMYPMPNQAGMQPRPSTGTGSGRGTLPPMQARPPTGTRAQFNMSTALPQGALAMNGPSKEMQPQNAQYQQRPQTGRGMVASVPPPRPPTSSGMVPNPRAKQFQQRPPTGNAAPQNSVRHPQCHPTGPPGSQMNPVQNPQLQASRPPTASNMPQGAYPLQQGFPGPVPSPTPGNYQSRPPTGRGMSPNYHVQPGQQQNRSAPPIVANQYSRAPQSSQQPSGQLNGSINHQANPNIGGPPQSNWGQQPSAMGKPGPGANKSDQSNQPSQRIDPMHLPRPTRSFLNEVYKSRASLLQNKCTVPRVIDEFVAMDDGNCSPRFMRMTMWNWPNKKSLLNQSEIPAAVVIQPFAPPSNGEELVPVISTGEGGPTRCVHCRAYVNLFCTFDHARGKWTCNLCRKQNDLPSSYQGDYNSVFGNVQQPELARASIDFVVSGNYVSRAPQEPIFLFVVDTSSVAIQSGCTVATLNCILQLVLEHVSGTARLTGGERARMGIVTFSQDLRFFQLGSPAKEGFRTLVVSDFEEGFCPLPHDRLAVNVDSNEKELVSLLQTLLETYGKQDIPQSHGASASICGTALEAAVNGLKECGGKVLLFSVSPPTLGQGLITDRKEMPKLYSTDAEQKLYSSPDSAIKCDTFFGQLAKLCCDSQVSINLYMFGEDHRDIALWSIPSNETGGCVQRFSLPLKGDSVENSRLQACVQEHVRSFSGLESVAKVRYSKGLTVAEYLGNGLKRTVGAELDMAWVDQNTAFVCELDHDGSNIDITKTGEQEVYLQCAVLYTTLNGQRRVRVHNLAIPVSDKIQDIFRFSDIDAVVAYLFRRSATKLLRGAFVRDIHASLNNAIVNILCTYRKNCARNPNSAQLILPEAFKCLSLYMLGALKSPLLRKNLDTLKSHQSPQQFALVRGDVRSVWINWALRSTPRMLMNSLYPVVFALPPNVTPANVGGGLSPSPTSILTFRQDNDNAYFMSDGSEMMLIFTRKTAASIFQCTGLGSFDEGLNLVKSQGHGKLPIQVSPRCNDFVSTLGLLVLLESQFPLASEATLLRSVRCIFFDDGDSDPGFVFHLVEDEQWKLQSCVSYENFLCMVHGSIRSAQQSW